MAVQVATDADFNSIIESNSKVVVKFWAGWCGTCRLFSPKFKRMSNDERFGDVIFLDVDAEANPETRKMVGVDNLPYFAVFKDGKLVEGDFTAKEETVLKMIEGLN